MTLRKVKNTPDKGVHGAVAESGLNILVDEFPNVSGEQIQKDKITIDAVSDGNVYSYKIDGSKISYTATSSDSKSDVASSLATNHNKDPTARGISKATTSSDTLTVEGLEAGRGFTFEQVDNNHYSYTDVQDAKSASDLNPGKGVVYVDVSGSKQLKLPEESDFTARTLRVEVTASADGDYRIFLDVLGDTLEAQYTASADSATDIATNLATSVESNSSYLAAEHVTDSGEFVEITPETDGFAEFDVTGTESPDEALVYTVNAAGQNFEDKFQGLIERSAKYTEDNAVGANDSVLTLQKGKMFHDQASSTSLGDRVFVEVRSSSDRGKIFTSHSDGRVPLKTGTARFDEDDKVILDIKDQV